MRGHFLQVAPRLVINRVVRVGDYQRRFSLRVFRLQFFKEMVGQFCLPRFIPDTHNSGEVHPSTLQVVSAALTTGKLDNTTERRQRCLVSPGGMVTGTTGPLADCRGCREPWRPGEGSLASYSRLTWLAKARGLVVGKHWGPGNGEGITVKEFVSQWLIPPRIVETISRLVDRVGRRRGGDKQFELSGHRVPKDSGSPAQLVQLRTARPRDVNWVPIDRLRTIQSTAFTSEQSHYVRYLVEGPKSLEDFYRVHRPHNQMEAIYLFGKEQGGDFQPKPPAPLEAPWESLDNKRQSALTDSPWFGPASPGRFQREVHRLDAAMASIKDHGFWMREGGDNLRYEIFLLDEEKDEEPDYRCVIRSGNHRIAVLAVLGWTVVPLVPMPVMVREIRFSDAHHWPRVLDGTFSLDAARAYFKAFFRQPTQKLLPGW